jgi:outer membrane lipoprotein-sorting protein
MRTTLSATLALGLLLTALGPAWTAEDPPDKIIAKGIKALGNEAKLSKARATTWKVKGTFHGLGNPVPYTGTMAVQLPDKFKMEMDFNNGEFKFARICAGDKGWVKLGDAINEMSKEQLDEQKESMHVSRVTRLVALKDKAYKLAPLGEVKVDKRPAVGIKVSHKGFRDVNLYFDKETGLLAKTETRIKDDMGQEANQETYYSDYKDVDGVKEPTKVIIKRDGNLFVEAENTDWKAVDKLDDSAFAKPS